MKQIALKGSLFIVSLFISLLLGEFLLRAIGYDTYHATTAHEIFWRYDPFLGWNHIPGQKGYFEKPQFRIKVEINRKGLRDDEHPYERVAGKKRILVLGDSLVWGYGVEQDYIFTEQLERLLSNTEVINAGVAGYSTDQELLWLRSEGERYNPDLVILVVCGNDDFGNRKDLIYMVYPKPMFTYGEDGSLVLRNVPVPRPSVFRKAIHSGCRYSSLVTFLVIRVRPRLVDLLTTELHALGRVARRYLGNESEIVSGELKEGNPFTLTLDLVGEMRKEAESRGSRFMIVSTSLFWERNYVGTYPQFVQALKNNNDWVLDLESVERYDTESMTIPGDGHWNRDGQKLVAESIDAFIEENGMLR